MQSKTCPKCLIVLPITAFRTRDRKRGTFQSWCRDCDTKYHIEKTIDKKLAAIKYLGGRCVDPDCPIPKTVEIHPGCFDFHHRNPHEKEFSWSQLKGKSWSVIVKELDKCDLLCCYCHRLYHTTIELPGGSERSARGAVSRDFSMHFWGTPLEINGEIKCISDWCQHYNISVETVKRRRKRGMTLIDSITKAKQCTLSNEEIIAGKLYTIDGVTQNISAWCRQFGITRNTYHARRRLGWDRLKAATTPLKSVPSKRQQS